MTVVSHYGAFFGALVILVSDSNPTNSRVGAIIGTRRDEEQKKSSGKPVLEIAIFSGPALE